MKENAFNYTLADAQATPIAPVSPERFDYARFAEDEQRKLEACNAFARAESGVLVCRRVRAGEVFRDACRDDRLSLALQLGALAQSLAFAGDVPAFLEPWYGIGPISSAYGAQYRFSPNQAPAVKPMFESCGDAAKQETRPVVDTEIGRKIMRQTEHFLSATGGRLPLSFTDLQSPLNTACQLVNIQNFFLDCMDEPEAVRAFLDGIAKHTIAFCKAQRTLIGGNLALPGHGFSSCRAFGALGLSDDNIVMLSPALYRNIALPAFAMCAEGFDGLAFHSCGDWTGKIDTVKQIPGLRMVDGAFTVETDPGANPSSAPFREGFAGSGIVVNMRAVGNAEAILSKVRAIWKLGMKLIVVTYCETPEEQAYVYREIHAICQ